MGSVEPIGWLESALYSVAPLLAETALWVLWPALHLGRQTRTILATVVGRMGLDIGGTMDTGEELYAYHGTWFLNAAAITFTGLKEAWKGTFGPGMYLTTQLSRAQAHGSYIYVVKF